MELTALTTYIKIGEIQSIRCPYLWINSVRYQPLSRYEIRLADVTDEAYQAIKKDDPVTIQIGYRNQQHAVWTGFVAKVSKNFGNVVVKVTGFEKPLVDTIIKENINNESAQAIVKFIINQTRLPVGIIDDPGVVLPFYIASSIPAWAAVEQVKQTCINSFKLNLSHWALWVSRDGKVNFGDFVEPEDIPYFNTGNGIIKNKSVKGRKLNCLETFILPGFSHSMEFELDDRRCGVKGVFMADEVVHIVDNAKARTFIYYEE